MTLRFERHICDKQGIHQQADGEVHEEDGIRDAAQGIDDVPSTALRRGAGAAEQEQGAGNDQGQRDAAAVVDGQGQQHGHGGHGHERRHGAGLAGRVAGPPGHEPQAIAAEEIRRPVIPARIEVEIQQGKSDARSDGQRHQPVPAPLAGHTATQPQQQYRQQIQLEIDGHVPGAGRQRLIAQHAVQQQGMGAQLAQGDGGRHGVVLHPDAGHRGDDGREQGGRQERRRQLGIAAPDGLQGGGDAGTAGRRERFGDEKAADDEEHLHGDARAAAQPAQQLGPQRLHVVGHGPVKRQMVQHDQLRRACLQTIDPAKLRTICQVRL